MRRLRWLSESLAWAQRFRRATPVPAPSWRRFFRQEIVATDVESLRALIHLGDQLALLQSLPEWAAVLEVKASLQAMADETCRLRPGASGDREDRLRALAAAEWWALEVFFSTIHRTIVQAQRARETMKTLVAPLP